MGQSWIWQRIIHTPNSIKSLLASYWSLCLYGQIFKPVRCLGKITLSKQSSLLEQLRILWHGEAIDVQIVPEVPVAAGVDTEDDVIRVEKLLLN